ncbi:sensor domain-containing diguanylate cyclase [Pelomonas sp. SE-A7]|uniref:GGDEF domain-containing protein n=1 Tax=Pelomonas sp. SE-A7 TaxID=3054953 RepID=UPI00259CE515|nr:sensor domain-containing diguanylate cyclase [Pelomonas sp. SE-A7]MDM4764749.1 sensor domain-containing diguanylate cyclase [Pelomonas sp. SE-A7]
MLVDQLKAENEALRRQLDSLLAAARSNDEKMRRFDQLEQALIAADTLPALLQLLLGEYRSAFGVEQISLSLVDREGELRRLFEGDPPALVALMQTGLRLLDSAAPLQQMHELPWKPWLGPYQSVRHSALFDEVPARVLRSVALLPLSRHGQLIGSLHFGSADPQRYESGTGTHFLERLSAITAVCLESTLNQERVKLAGLTDALTGVHNRRYFEHRQMVEISLAIRYRHPLACMFLDVDHFKRINDGHGHGAGDAVLRQMGQLIQGQLRLGDTIARWGGEEFVVLLPRTHAAHAAEIAERIRVAIAARPLPLPGGGSLPVTASIGVAMLRIDPKLREPRLIAEGLLKQADQALYAAKEGGRNRVVRDVDPGSFTATD